MTNLKKNIREKTVKELINSRKYLYTVNLKNCYKNGVFYRYKIPGPPLGSIRLYDNSHNFCLRCSIHVYNHDINEYYKKHTKNFVHEDNDFYSLKFKISTMKPEYRKAFATYLCRELKKNRENFMQMNSTVRVVSDKDCPNFSSGFITKSCFKRMSISSFVKNMFIGMDFPGYRFIYLEFTKIPNKKLEFSDFYQNEGSEMYKINMFKGNKQRERRVKKRIKEYYIKNI